MSESFIIPVHDGAGNPQIKTSIDMAIEAAALDGVIARAGVGQAWAPAGYAYNDGGPEFQQWLKGRGMELCKGKVGKWWTVVFAANVTKRDSYGIAVRANKPFPFPNEKLEAYNAQEAAR